MLLSASILALVIVTFVAMEGAAWAAHKYLMHGPLWFLHKSHHRPHSGWLELNDIYALMFAAISIALMTGGPLATPVPFAIGLGMAFYGLAYFLVHDVMVHRRIPHRFVPKRGFLRRVFLAHKLHHAVRERDGAVAFGFIMPPNPDRLAAQLKANRQSRYCGTVKVRTCDWVPSE